MEGANNSMSKEKPIVLDYADMPLEMDYSLIASLGVDDAFENKIRLSEKNIARVLSPLDLDDLIVMYILSKNPGYMFLPSSYKDYADTGFSSSYRRKRPLQFGFRFVKDGEKPLLCQVERQEELPPLDNYTNETSYQKIYLYSGLYNKEHVEELKANYKEYSQLEFISSSDLLINLTNEGFEYIRHKLEQFYQIVYEAIDFTEVLKACGYTETTSFRSKKNKYMYENGNYYIDGRNLWYSEDLNAFFVNGDLDKYQNTISLLTEEMCK